jgi:hypothetical protein
MSPDLPWLVRNWRAFAYCARLTRFSLLVLTAAGALRLVAQGQDLLISIAEDARYVWFAGSVSIWAFSIWLWARVLLDIRFPEPPGDLRLYNFWRRHLPRALGALAFGVAVLACSRNAETATLAWIALAAGVLFWVLVAKRRSAAQGLARRIARTRVGRGAKAATRLEDWAREHGRFASFRMCRPSPDQAEPPLGWALSEAAQRVIKGYLGATPCPGNNEALVNVQHWLKR